PEGGRPRQGYDLIGGKLNTFGVVGEGRKLSRLQSPKDGDLLQCFDDLVRRHANHLRECNPRHVLTAWAQGRAIRPRRSRGELLSCVQRAMCKHRPLAAPTGTPPAARNGVRRWRRGARKEG